MSDRQVTCWYIATPCPQCGSTLATDGRKVWCIGAGSFLSCPYGHDDEQLLKDIHDAQEDDERCRH